MANEDQKTVVNDEDQKTVVNNEEAFKNWMKTQEWRSGVIYSDSTCKDYAKAINDMSEVFLLEILPYKNIFNIDNLDEFDFVQNKIKNHPGFKEYNKSTHKWRQGTPSAALSLYKKFLCRDAIPKGREHVMLFNEALLKEALEQYKNDFPDWFEKEKYKWEAVATFRKYWDINATDFATMFKNSLSKTEDLLKPYSGNKAKEVIISLAETAPEAARAAFKDLFNKDGDVIERIREFKAKVSALYQYYDIPNRDQPQNEYTITTFLWLWNPEDYCIYKTNIVCTLAARIGYIHSFRGSFKDCYNEFCNLCSILCSYICKDENFISTVGQKLTDTCYPDLKHRILTADFISYIKQKDDDDNSYDGYWWLVSNPRIWRLSECEIGEEQNYTLRNDNGQPRQIQNNFLNVKLGNKVIGYQTNPNRKLVAICEIVRESNGENIRIRKLKAVDRDVDLDKLRTIPEIQNMEWFKNPNGTLFKLNESEYNCLMELVNGTYKYPPEPGIKSGTESGTESGQVSEAKNDYQKNLIFFGAPGTGKSHDLNVLKDKFFDDYNHKGDYERVTFHPDYSYAHFVGTYKPVVPDTDQDKGEITYEYVPGPFMRIYAKAKTRPEAKFLLIIEEINRANVAAVFGDIFQLLDRTKDGYSEYPIAASEDMKVYLRSKGVKDYDKVAIPPNMYIWATMNSADQGVFPMDTAFKRRWEFKYLGINHGAGVLNGCKVPIPRHGTDEFMEWNVIRQEINELLASEDINVNEDKQLGAFFIGEKIIREAQEKPEVFKETFKNKVLMYLFEDAAKHKREKLFGSKTIRYSEICKIFDKYGLGVFEKHKDLRVDSKPTSESDIENSQDQTDATNASSGEDN